MFRKAYYAEACQDSFFFGRIIIWLSCRIGTGRPLSRWFSQFAGLRALRSCYAAKFPEGSGITSDPLVTSGVRKSPFRELAYQIATRPPAWNVAG